MKPLLSRLLPLIIFVSAGNAGGSGAEGVFVRFQLIEPPQRVPGAMQPAMKPAAIEMVQEAGEETFFLFGRTADQVVSSRGWYTPRWHYENEPETKQALGLIAANQFSPKEPGLLSPILDALLAHGDYHMHLADLKSYLEADQRLVDLYRDPTA